MDHLSVLVVKPTQAGFIRASEPHRNMIYGDPFMPDRPDQNLPEPHPNVTDAETLPRPPESENSMNELFGPLIILLAIVGLVGNIPSLCYFWRRRKKTIHDFLYTIASKLDALISVASFLVAHSLLNSRTPQLFQSPVVCYFWPFAWDTLQRLSILTVVLISVLRSILIVYPIKLRTSRITIVVSLASIALMFVTAEIVFLNKSSQIRLKYVEDTSQCSITLTTGEKSQTLSWTTRIYSVIVQLELIIQCMAVFVSFLVSSISLRKKKVMQNDDERKFRRVSITIVLFTALFLVSTLPSFMLQVTYFIRMFHSFAMSKYFLRSQYAHLVCSVILPLLNSAANPWLYLWRMPQYRAWLRNMVKNLLKGRVTGNRKDRLGRRRARVFFNFFRRFNIRPTFSVSWRGEGGRDQDGRVQIGEDEPP